MKQITLLLIAFFFNSLISEAQAPIKKPAAKKTTSTTKKTATTPIKKTTTVAKPVTTTTTNTVVAPSKEEVLPPAPAKPPVTGPIKEGPKSYESKTTATEPAKQTKTETSKKTATNEANKNAIDKSKNNVSKAPKQKKYSSKQSYFGLKGGLNLSKIEGFNDTFNATGIAKEVYAQGYMGGLVLNLGLSKSVSLQPEIIYNQLGTRFENETTNEVGLEIQEDIITIPVLLKIAFGSENIKFFINGGPYGGYKLSAKQKLLNAPFKKIEYKNEYDPITGAKTNRLEYGAMGGAGLQFKLGGPVLVLEGRYQYSLSNLDVYKTGFSRPSSLPNDYGRYRNLNGSIALLFPIGGR